MQASLRAYEGRRYVGEVRGVGFLGAIELYADPSNRVPFDPAIKAGARLAKIALGQGLIVRALGDTIVFCPPLIITQDELAELFARFGRSMAVFVESIE